MKRILILILSIAFCYNGFSSFNVSAESANNPIVDAKKAVVSIASGIYFDDSGDVRTYDPKGKYSTGTGFGVSSDGEWANVFATNCHVVEKDSGDTYDFVYICIDGADLSDESTLVKCEVIYSNSQIDIALVKADKQISGVTILPLCEAESMQTSDRVYALGFPGIADEASDNKNYTVDDITVTDGIISRYLTSDGRKCMAHTAVISHGNSGGPLINEKGQVIGINTFGITDLEMADTRYYAVYIDYIMDVLDELDISYQNALNSDVIEEETTNNDENSGETDLFDKNSIIIYIALGVGVLVAIFIIFKITKKKPNHNDENTGVADNINIAENIPESVPDNTTSYYICGKSSYVKGQTWRLKDTLVIGRNTDLDIVLPANTKGVSRQHCRIELKDGKVKLIDLKSSQGTYINRKRIQPNVYVDICENTEIALGSTRVIFTLKCDK